MKLARGAIPLYYQIAQILRSQIDAREFKPNEMLQTEDEMIRAFQVSRTTVRQALQILHNEGLIYRIAGKGTFVAEKTQARHEVSVGSIEEIITASYTTKLDALERENIRANEELAKGLQVAIGTEITQFRGLRSVDGKPFFHFILSVPDDIAGKIPLEHTGDEPIMALVERFCNVQIQKARQWTAASLAGSEVAHLLDIRLGDPVLLVERHYIDKTGRVVGVAMDRYRTDRIRHFLCLTRALPSHAHGSEPGRVENWRGAPVG